MEYLLNEYGNKVYHISFYEGYLNEYGDLLIEKTALNVLKAYFAN
jgi:negative regulator of genetic competence, sporulation and motility